MKLKRAWEVIQMIPNLKNVKIYRVNTNNNTLLVWSGGSAIHQYSFNTNEEKMYKVVNPQRPDFPTFMEVKRKMRDIIANENQ